jgi:hypothetical protein
MLKRLRTIARQILNPYLTIESHLDQIKQNQGLILSELNKKKIEKDIRSYEFKIFSQWGEDGIIQHLTRVVEIKNKTFIEFGVEDFFESNCRYLMTKDSWRGYVIDGSLRNIARLKNSHFFWKHQLEANCAFITRSNINQLLEQSGFDYDLGILSIDLDGMDYFVLEAITNYKPRILICEFNPVFGATRKVTVPYKDNFNRTSAHYSNLYGGASLSAVTHLAKKKGYSLVGTNSAGQNAFFVRQDLVNENLMVMTAEEAYTNPNFRESRDLRGSLNFLSAQDRLNEISGLPVLNVETDELETL